METLDKKKHHIVVIDMRLPVYSVGEQIVKLAKYLLEPAIGYPHSPEVRTLTPKTSRVPSNINTIISGKSV